MSTLKSVCKLIFPGRFKKLLDKLEDALNETNKRDKRKMYIKIKKEYESLKSETNNSCNEDKKYTNKKIDVLSLLLILLENDIEEINKSNMVKINNDLLEILDELDKLNISINTVDKGEEIARKKIKEMAREIKHITNVELHIKNMGRVFNAQEKEKSNEKTRLNRLQNRLNTLRRNRSTTPRNVTNGGKRKTRKVK